MLGGNLRTNDKVTFALAGGGRGQGKIVGSETIGGNVVIYTVLSSTGWTHKFLAKDLQPLATKKPVRSISRKVNDIAEAAWSHGDGASREDEDYGCVGPDAERRADRMVRQVETLAIMAITGLHRDVTIAAVNACPRRDELLASALVGDWDRVNQILGDIRANTTTPDARDCCVTGECESDGEDQAGDLADPQTGATIRLEPRDPASLFNFPCCGGLRPAHTSNCREA